MDANDILDEGKNVTVQSIVIGTPTPLKCDDEIKNWFF